MWAGRREVGFVGQPTARASVAYRLARLVASLALRGAFGFRIEVEGREHLPRTADGRPAVTAVIPMTTIAISTVVTE